MNEQFHPGRVSIVIPAYKADQYLAETLDTIALQDHTDWEVIVIEDASTGRTEGIVRDFAKRHPERRVEYFRHMVNQGPSATRNTAFTHVQGEFVAFLDADDLWTRDQLSESLKALAASGADVAYSASVMFEHDTGHLVWIWGPTKEEREGFPNALVDRNFITPSSVVMRRTVLDRAGDFDTSFRTCEDLDYWLRCVSVGVRFVCVAGCHCMYRKGDPGAATSKLNRITVDFTKVLEKHWGMEAIPIDVQKVYLRKQYLVAARWNTQEPRVAFAMLWKGIRVSPYKLDRAVLRASYDVFLSAVRKLATKLVRFPSLFVKRGAL